VSMHLKAYEIDGYILRTGSANYSGLKQLDDDLVLVERAEAIAAFESAFEAQFASGEALPLGANRSYMALCADASPIAIHGANWSSFTVRRK